MSWAAPYLEFQSTIGLLKDPPEEYLLPGVDVFGGMQQISQNIDAGVYASQWAFEKDMHNLVNFLPHDFHLNLAMPLTTVFSFRSGEPIVSISDNSGVSVPQVYFICKQCCPTTPSMQNTKCWQLILPTHRHALP